MPTSTNRPKPKPGQSAGKQPTGKLNKDQAANGSTHPLAKKKSDSTELAARSTNGSTQPAAKTSDSDQPTAKKESGSLESAAPSTSDSDQSAAKKTSDSLKSETKAGSTTTQPLAKTGGSRQPLAKTGTGSTSAPARTTKATGSFKVIPKPEPQEKTQPAARVPLAKRQAGRYEQKREVRRDDISHRIDERRQQREREQRNRSLKRWGIIGGSVLAGLLVVAIIAYQIIAGLNLPAYEKGVPIDGISCDTLEQSVSHYHAHLAIYVNGQPVSIPDDIGRQAPNCFYWLHTHQITGDDGVIHIESPDTRTFQLYQFFDIWGQQLSATNLMGHAVDSTHKLAVYVFNPAQSDVDAHNQEVAAAQQQGQTTLPSFTVTPTSGLTPSTGDPRKIQLKSYELIVLEYGTTSQFVAPPAFTFNGGE